MGIKETAEKVKCFLSEKSAYVICAEWIFVVLFIGFAFGAIVGQKYANRKEVDAKCYDAVLLTLSAITYKDANGNIYLKYPLEETAEYFAEN